MNTNTLALLTARLSMLTARFEGARPPAAPAESASTPRGPQPPPGAASRVASLGALVMTALGIALFVYTIQRAGVAETLTSIRHVGLAGFLAILVLSGLRFVVRARAWTMCVERPHELSFGQAFEATLIGEALGTMTPLGTFISEPSKAVLVRRELPLGAALSAIAVENLVYIFSVSVVIVLGTLAFLLNYHLGEALRHVSEAAILIVGAAVAVGVLVLVRGATPLTTALDWTAKRWPGRTRGEAVVERVRRVESRIYSFYGRYRHRLLPLLALEASFHLAGIAEVYVTLLLGTHVLSAASGGAVGTPAPAVTLLAALILETTGRIINVLFKFIPFRLGVDEAGAALVAGAMGLGGAAGVTLAVVRKARILCWTALGVLLLARRGLSVRAIVRDAASTRGAGA